MAIGYQRTGGPLQRPPSQDSLADILERVLDKGIVIAGDIQINLLDIELLTIKLRLIVASIDKAKEMGIDWWESDPALNAQTGRLAEENRLLRERLDRVEHVLAPPERATDGGRLGKGVDPAAPGQADRGPSGR